MIVDASFLAYRITETPITAHGLLLTAYCLPLTERQFEPLALAASLLSAICYYPHAPPCV